MPCDIQLCFYRVGGVQPGCHGNGEESYDAGILEPMEPPADVAGIFPFIIPVPLLNSFIRHCVVSRVL